VERHRAGRADGVGLGHATPRPQGAQEEIAECQ
jgi:hypothetical protein